MYNFFINKLLNFKFFTKNAQGGECMQPKYKSLLSPLKVRGFVLKNRMSAANSLPHFLQGPEPYPADSVISHYANKAKGASIVTCMGINNCTIGKQFPMDLDFGHFPDFDLYDCNCQNYLLQLADTIHFYDSIAAMGIFVGPPSSYPLMRKKQANIVQGNVNGASGDIERPFDTPNMDEFEIELIEAHKLPHEYDEETLEKIAKSYAEQAGILNMLDFDMLSLHFAYRGNLPAKFMSPITNHRTDQWGGSLENRMRFPLMVLKAVREQVGEDFLIEILWSAEDLEGGYTLADTVTFLKEASKYIDIVQLRAPDADPAHPTGFNPEETPFLHYSEYVKKHVDNLIVATIGGYQDLDTCERAIAEGKTDLISMARAWISNPDYGRLALEGRNEDVVPCLRCNKCHGRGETDPFQSVCSVNPIIGLEHKIDRMIQPVRKLKTVAIIGGGPAGMRCAMYLADRGHHVTIYEQSDKLGGAIIHSDYVDFKWPLRKFKDFLIYQVNKRDNITIKLNTKATPDLLKAENYDVIISAIGAVQIAPPISGLSDSKHICFAEKAFMNHESLGKNVVVIGGGEVGVEAGMYLAEHNHHVTVLEMRDTLAADTTKIHYRSMFQEAWEALPLFHAVTGAKVIAVNDQAVTYIDKDGKENTISADSIVISAGAKAKTDEALSFYGITGEFHMIGDCRKPATIQETTRSAFATAVTI